MNEGVVEARELAAHCCRVLEGVNSLASLESYGSERLARWRGLLAAREAAAANGTIRDPWLIANASAILEALPAAGEAADLLARIVST
jgi:hypothetical protein